MKKKKFSFNEFVEKHYVLKESLLATLFTIIITFGVSFIGIKYEFSKAIRQDFSGFDVYDLYYSNRHLENSQRDSNIIIVEIADDREGIAGQIDLIQKYKPSVIGIDAYFLGHEDVFGSLKLAETMGKYNNIVVGSKYIDSPDAIIPNYFDATGVRCVSGYCNFIGNEYSVIRYYPPFLKIRDSVYPSFSSAIAERFSVEKFNKLKKRKNKREIINYTGNQENYSVLSGKQLEEADSTSQLEGKLENKIVLLGYFVKEPLYPVLNDLHFSPVNKRISGKSYPDMYGVVIHANILSMILNENYASQPSDFVSYLLACLIIFLFLYYMLSQYRKKQHPKHGKFLLIQFLLVLLMLFIFVQIFNLFLIKVPLLPIMIALVLCVELLGVYKNIALWLHRKYQYKTVFAHKHII